ncbi:MAG: type II toxin-antitoxin system prevent-host-death family antitoxin [Patescibacteria group bacterium]
MKIVNIHQAKTHFSALVDAVGKGQTVVIGKAGKPVVKLIKYSSSTDSPQPRPGMYSGAITISDDFTAESDEISQLFYGKDDA